MGAEAAQPSAGAGVWKGRPAGLPGGIPPPSVPLSFLAAAALGLVACGVALIWSRAYGVVDPTDDRVVGAAHFAMLATLSMGILGAIHQFTPVITQRPLRSVRLCPRHIPGLASRRMAASPRLCHPAGTRRRNRRGVRRRGRRAARGERLRAVVSARERGVGHRAALRRDRIRGDRVFRSRLRDRPPAELVRPQRSCGPCPCHGRPVCLAGAHLHQRLGETAVDVPARPCAGSAPVGVACRVGGTRWGAACSRPGYSSVWRGSPGVGRRSWLSALARTSTR